MPNYDASIRVSTKINTKSAEVQLERLENQILKSADKVNALRSKMDLLKDVKAPTQEYQEISSQIGKAGQKLVKLLEKQEQMQGEGKTSGVAWERINNQITEAKNEIDYAKGELQALVDTGKAFVIGNPAETEKISQQLQYEENNLASLAKRQELLNAKIQAQMEEEQRLALIKENATVADQEMVSLLERRRQLLQEIADMVKAGVTEGYQEYDDALGGLAGVQEQISVLRQSRDEAGEARSAYIGLGDAMKQAFKNMAKGLAEIPIVTVKAGVKGLITAFQKLGSIVKNIASGSFRLLGSTAKRALSGMHSIIGKTASGIKRLGERAKKSFSGMNSSIRKSNGTFSAMGAQVKGLAALLLRFELVKKVFSSALSFMKEGFGNLYKDNERFKNSVDELNASVLTLKNALAAAFRPLVDIAIPYIQKAAGYITGLLDKVGQFTAAITGQKTYTKAVRQTADAFKDAKKAAEGYLSPLDEINKYSDGTSKDADENQFGQMFEELPIEQKFTDIANKVKDVLKDLFAPIKEAWNREGEFVIDSWKYGLKEVGKLLKDIGRDFLKVWKQPATIAMLQDILHTFGDVGLIVGNLASKFREAWNYNNTGLHILENIRDIFAVIIHNIREAADYTVEWTKTLDFTPLLQGVERLTASMVPFFDFLSGTLADFYTKFLLPLASWTLSEEGIPRLLNILADFMESVNWEGLRTALASLYSALEPYAEAIGTGFIDFIERMKEYGVDFLNWLPEHIQSAADALRNGDLPSAFEEFGRISGEAMRTAFSFIKETIESINWGEIGTLIASFINGIDWNGVFESLSSAITTVLNSAIDFIYNFITKTDWNSIGAAFGTNLSNAWKSIDWARLGQIVSEGIKSVFDFLLQAINNIDWYEVGRKVGEFLSNIDWIGIINKALTLLFTLPQIIWDALSGAISAVDWGQLIRDIATALRDFFLNFDWMGFFESAGQLYGNVMKAIFDIVDAAIEIGKNIVDGLKKGIEDGFSGIVEWVKTHIFDPFINGFKSAFDIHSPSTVMAEMGMFIIEGLLGGIIGAFKSIASWIRDNIFIPFINGFKSLFGINSDSSAMRDIGVNVMNGFLNGLKNVWDSITRWIEEKIGWIVEKFRDIGGKISGFFSGGGGDSGQGYSARSYSMRSMAPMASPYAVNPAFAALSKIEIPGYATGQVIPRTMKKHLAYLGDNNHETEVVSPLSTIKEANREALLEVLSELGLTGGMQNNGGNTYNIKAIANSGVIFEMIIQEGIKRLVSEGENPFDLITT